MLHDVLLSGPGTTLFDVPASRLRSVDSVPVATLRQARLDADFFRLFTFLLDKNGQLNYNIDITEPKAWI